MRQSDFDKCFNAIGLALTAGYTDLRMPNFCEVTTLKSSCNRAPVAESEKGFFLVSAVHQGRDCLTVRLDKFW